MKGGPPKRAEFLRSADKLTKIARCTHTGCCAQRCRCCVFSADGAVLCLLLRVMVLFLSIYPSTGGTQSIVCLANGNKGAWSVTMPFMKRGLHRDFRIVFTLEVVAYFSARFFGGTGRFCCVYCSLPSCNTPRRHCCGRALNGLVESNLRCTVE